MTAWSDVVPLPAGTPVPELWFEDHGTGPAVVLLHGLADTHDLWRYQVPVLSERYRVITVDHYGHGRTPPWPGELTTAIMADGVARLIARLGIAPATVVGLSMGGGVAQVLALRAPRLVRALVLVSTGSEFSPATRERFHRRADQAEREGMSAVLDTTVPRWFTERFMTAHPDEVAHTRRTVLANDPAAFAAASRANAMRGWTERLGEIDCPLLFIGGAADPADAAASGARYREALPRATVQVWPGLSHLVPVEAPARFNEALLAFLDGLPPVQAATAHS
jgi:pimeloyl-ACP methyl ester carboxylesterase